jgi:Raf kinase inhibitor-like YbhB/YbcL family protein
MAATVNGNVVRHALARVGLVPGVAAVAAVAAVALAAATGCSSSSPNPPASDDGSFQGDTGSATVADSSVAEGSADASTGSVSDSSVIPEGSTSTGDGGIDASTDGGAGIVVTSPAFAEGQPIPLVYTCAGADTSPEIDWTAGPATTQSYAVVVSDLTATANIHWVVWDIPPGTRSLPAMFPTDPTVNAPVSAKQVDLRTNPEAGTTMNGFFGPCPRGALHSYEFAVHAMDVATLPGVTTMSRSADVKVVVLAHSVAQGVLDGTSDATPPTDAGGQ